MQLRAASSSGSRTCTTRGLLGPARPSQASCPDLHHGRSHTRRKMEERGDAEAIPGEAAKTTREEDHHQLSDREVAAGDAHFSKGGIHRMRNAERVERYTRRFGCPTFFLQHDTKQPESKKRLASHLGFCMQSSCWLIGVIGGVWN